MLLTAMADAGATADQTLIIGDTVFDMLMGSNAGVRAIGVDWGYHDAGELIDSGAVAVAVDTAQLRALIDG
jgi:phosphoglycolate phosphatase